jgi:hypothetical protein
MNQFLQLAKFLSESPEVFLQELVEVLPVVVVAVTPMPWRPPLGQQESLKMHLHTPQNLNHLTDQGEPEAFPQLEQKKTPPKVRLPVLLLQN